MESRPAESSLATSLQTVKTQGFVSITHLLADSFKANVALEQTKTFQQLQMESMLQMLPTRLQFGLTKNAQQATKMREHLKLMSVLLYGSVNFQTVLRNLASGFKSMGVCAKSMKVGDVAWKCEDCEKDSTCIICQDCFNKSDHKGHRVWLKTNVSGCCDCGDPDAWEPKGFCSDHQGFSASTDAMLAALPDYIKQSATPCFNSLACQLKSILLQVHDTSHLKEMVKMIVTYLNQACTELPSNIYYISKALPQVFAGQHKSTHKCSYRYFVSEEHKQDFVTHQDTCTCSVLDLLCQTSNELDKATNQMLYDLLFKLFQTYEFKQHLAFAYIANLEHLLNGIGEDKSLITIGVQLLTIDSIVTQIMQDANLRAIIVNANAKAWSEFVSNPQDGLVRWKTVTLFCDLKYMARPNVIPQILQSSFIDDLIERLKVFHFQDCVTCPTEMQAFDQETQIVVARADLEFKVVNVIYRYLRQLTDDQASRLVALIETNLASLDISQHKGKGFVSMPLIKVLAFIVTSKKLVLPETTQKIAIEYLAQQNGFLAEIKSKLWIYKGETFQMLPLFFTEQLKESYWPDLGLLQCLFAMDPLNIDRYCQLFGTFRTPLSDLLKSDAQQNNHSKLGFLVQQLLTRIVHCCISEIMFSDPKLSESVIQRELVHVLFMLGASATSERIVKQSNKIFTKDPQYLQMLQRVATQQLDQNGKITFKLKEEYLSLYDPYYFVNEKHITFQNASYAMLGSNPRLNNIVGDYQHYKYATSINSQVWAALAQSQFKYFVTEVVGIYLTGNSQINLQSFNAGLKLLIIILQSTQDQEYLKFVKEQILNPQSKDEKVQEILNYIQKLVHGSEADSPMQTQLAEPVSTAKLSIQQKQQEMIAKMKLRQKTFIQQNQSKEPEEVKEPQRIVLHCAACQEQLETGQFAQRSFVQLGYTSRTKLLFHTYSKTNTLRQQQHESLQFGGSGIQQPKADELLSLTQLRTDEDQLLGQMGLDSVVDADTKCGVQFNRCCHYFHTDCLRDYITAEFNKTHQALYVQSMIGLEDNMIQCPLCKGISNTYMPYLPATTDTKDLMPYIDFFSQILGTPQREPKTLFPASIAKNPESFLQQVMEFVTCQLLTLTSYRQAELFKLYDPQSPLNSFTLRDLVFIIKSTITLIPDIKQVSQDVLVSLSTINYTENPFLRNHAKLVVQLLFLTAFHPGFEQYVLNLEYSVFKAHIAASELYDQDSNSEIWPELMKATQLTDSVVIKQLQFLRVAAAMKLITDALHQHNDQLGLDIGMIKQIETQTEDHAEFALLTSYLQLDTSFSTIYQGETVDGVIAESVLGATSLFSSLESQLKKWQKTPVSMNVLIPLTSFQLYQLPSDFQSLVHQFYQKQCRNCQKQLQNNAICLLCGEVVCFMPKDNCCQGLPGMRQEKTLHAMFGLDTSKTLEGELSYHARHWEGGCAVFVLPATGQVFLIDNGRIAETDSFYRNEVGGQFKQTDSQKWENYYCNEKTGGIRVQKALQRAVVNGEVPNNIVQERTKKGSVIRRSIY